MGIKKQLRKKYGKVHVRRTPTNKGGFERWHVYCDCCYMNDHTRVFLVDSRVVVKSQTYRQALRVARTHIHNHQTKRILKRPLPAKF